MKSRNSRLDRFIARQESITLREVQSLIAQCRVHLDGKPATSISQTVGQFSHVTLDQRVLQDNRAHYVMLHKPEGVVSATTDKHHRTVIDLLPQAYARSLHIAGRLDFNSTGLMLLTNDGRWSRRLSEPESAITKTYQVLLEKPLNEDYIAAFAEGMHFAFEGVTTRPAKLKLLCAHRAEVSLIEGRYHQIKRMFGHFDNRVLSLHRSAIGELSLAQDLAPGQSRELSEAELARLGVSHNFRD